jgi:uncharacterized protein (DUF427 family)
MALLLGRHLLELHSQLQYEPTAKRLRVLAGDRILADTRRAVLVWQPKRVVPSYAVPAADLAAELRPADPGPAATERTFHVGALEAPFLDPRTPFAVHTCEGEPLTLVAGGIELPGAGFRPADPDLAGYVVLDFDAFTWLEDEERVYAHPRDPFKRIDVRQSAERVRIERDGQVLADSARPKILYETHIVQRYYLPREDVRTDLLKESDTRSWCAYKGEATYWSVEQRGETVRDLCWTLEDPLSDGVDVRGMIAFFNERVDISVDGVPQDRPITPWSESDR